MNWFSIIVLVFSAAGSLHAFPYLYVAQNDGSTSIVDIESPSSPTYQNSAQSLPAFALTMLYNDQSLYGPTSNQLFLFRWDYITPSQPVFVQNAPGINRPWGVLVPPDFPNFWTPGGGINIFSAYPMFDPTNPLGDLAPLQSTDFFAIYPNSPYLYTLQNNILETTNIANPEDPTLEPGIPINANHLAIHPTGSNLYVVDTVNLVLSVFDLTTPGSPVLLPINLPTGAGPQSLMITPPAANYLYVVNQTDGSISIFDIQTPSSPVAISTFTVPNLSLPYSLISSPDGSTLYVANQGTNTISVLDISSPTSPVWIEDLSLSQMPTYMTISAPFPYPFSRIPN